MLIVSVSHEGAKKYDERADEGKISQRRKPGSCFKAMPS